MTRRPPFANPASLQPSVYETYEPAPAWTPPPFRRGWVPGRALLLGGWLLLAAAVVLDRAEGHPAILAGARQLLLAVAGWAAGGVPVLLACRPFRRTRLFPVWRRPPLAATFSVVCVLAGLLVVGGSFLLLGEHSLNAIQQQPGLVLAAFAGLTIAAGAAVRWRRLTSYHWPYSRDGLLVPPSWWGRRRWLGLVATAAVLLAPPVLVARGAQAPQIGATSSTAAGPLPAAAPVPSRISAVAWRARLPEGEHVVRLLAGTAGPVAVVHSEYVSGVRAYRGDTGEELWHYFGASGSNPARATATPDHRRVVVATDNSGGNPQQTMTTRYVVLDSARGTVVGQFSHAAQEGHPAPVGLPFLLAGDDVVIEDHGNGYPLIALSLRDGSQLWSAPAQQGCGTVPTGIAQDVLVEQFTCPDGTAGTRWRLSVRGLLLATGQVGWSHTFGPVAADASLADVQVADDGSMATVNHSLFDWVIRPDTGELLFSARSTPDFAGSPVPVSGGWVTRTGLTGDHLQVVSQARRVIYDSDAAKDKTGWLLLRGQLVHYTLPDAIQLASEPLTARQLAENGVHASALTVSPLLTKRTRAAGSSETRITLLDDPTSRIAGPGPGDDQPLVAVPGAVVVHLIQRRAGSGDHLTSTLIGLR